MEIFIDDVTYTSLDVDNNSRRLQRRRRILDGMDIDRQATEMQKLVAETNDLAHRFDHNDDGVVDQDDRTEWVSNLKKTLVWRRESSMAMFNSGDLVFVFGG